MSWSIWSPSAPFIKQNSSSQWNFNVKCAAFPALLHTVYSVYGSMHKLAGFHTCYTYIAGRCSRTSGKAIVLILKSCLEFIIDCNLDGIYVEYRHWQHFDVRQRDELFKERHYSIHWLLCMWFAASLVISAYKNVHTLTLKYLFSDIVKRYLTYNVYSNI